MALLALILPIALGATYLVAGAYKLVTPRAKLLRNPNLGWVQDYRERSVKGIGLAEVLGAIGLFVPWYTWVAPVLTPVAAVLLAVLQGLAVPVHLRRHEAKVVPGNVLLLVMALLVAGVRFFHPYQGTQIVLV